jgi:hypothetical protein
MGAELGSCGAPGGARTCNLLLREVSARPTRPDECGSSRSVRVLGPAKTESVRSGCGRWNDGRNDQACSRQTTERADPVIQSEVSAHLNVRLVLVDGRLLGVAGLLPCSVPLWPVPVVRPATPTRTDRRGSVGACVAPIEGRSLQEGGRRLDAPAGPAATSSDLFGGRRWPGMGHPRRADGFTS